MRIPADKRRIDSVPDEMQEELWQVAKELVKLI